MPRYCIQKVKGFIFDFDGVLTNNLVSVDANGIEAVVCSRADGIGFDMLRQFNKIVHIFSSESNIVVSKRAEKLKVAVMQSVSNKSEKLGSMSEQNGWDLSHFAYVGNDLNDYHAMLLCGYKFCPNDAHPEIKNICTEVLQTKGGHGVVRELVEDVFEINPLNYLR